MRGNAAIARARPSRRLPALTARPARVNNRRSRSVSPVRRLRRHPSRPVWLRPRARRRLASEPHLLSGGCNRRLLRLSVRPGTDRAPVELRPCPWWVGMGCPRRRQPTVRRRRRMARRRPGRCRLRSLARPRRRSGRALRRPRLHRGGPLLENDRAFRCRRRLCRVASAGRRLRRPGRPAAASPRRLRRPEQVRRRGRTPGFGSRASRGHPRAVPVRRRRLLRWEARAATVRRCSSRHPWCHRCPPRTGR
jgi:hypothetical protein